MKATCPLISRISKTSFIALGALSLFAPALYSQNAKAKKNASASNQTPLPNRSAPARLDEDKEFLVDLERGAEKTNEWSPSFSGDGLVIVRYGKIRHPVQLSLRNGQGKIVSSNAPLPENAGGVFLISRVNKDEVFSTLVKNPSSTNRVTFSLSVRKSTRESDRLIPDYGFTSDIKEAISNAQSLMLQGDKNMKDRFKQIEGLIDSEEKREGKNKAHPNLDNLKRDFAETRSMLPRLGDILEKQQLSNQIVSLFDRFNQCALKRKVDPLSMPEWKNEMTLAQIESAIAQVRKAVPNLNGLAEELKEISIALAAFIDKNTGKGNDELLDGAVFKIEEIPTLGASRKANLAALQKHVDQISQVAFTRMVSMDGQLGIMEKRYNRDFAASLTGDMKDTAQKFGPPAEVRAGKKKGTVEWVFERSKTGQQEETVFTFDEKTGKLLRKRKPTEPEGT
ncbi:MAG: hypothetical protein JNM63_10200 [Spirochaetia bacterium]|nr:hypothetical protein [Spirochaetia bacterium]